MVTYQSTIQNEVGDVEIKVPKVVHDRSKQGIKFNSSLLPPYLKQTNKYRRINTTWLYLKGISTGGFQEALVGDQAKALSANTISRLKAN